MGKKKKERNKIEIEKCACGKYPEASKGKVFGKEEVVWTVFCNNNRCKEKPSTGQCYTRKRAITEWNNKITTNSMF